MPRQPNPNRESKTVNLPSALHRAISISARERGTTIQGLIGVAFEHLLATEKQGIGPMPRDAMDFLKFLEIADADLRVAVTLTVKYALAEHSRQPK